MQLNQRESAALNTLSPLLDELGNGEREREIVGETGVAISGGKTKAT